MRRRPWQGCQDAPPVRERAIIDCTGIADRDCNSVAAADTVAVADTAAAADTAADRVRSSAAQVDTEIALRPGGSKGWGSSSHTGRRSRSRAGLRRQGAVNVAGDRGGVAVRRAIAQVNSPTVISAIARPPVEAGSRVSAVIARTNAVSTTAFIGARIRKPLPPAVCVPARIGSRRIPAIALHGSPRDTAVSTAGPTTVTLGQADCR